MQNTLGLVHLAAKAAEHLGVRVSMGFGRFQRGRVDHNVAIIGIHWNHWGGGYVKRTAAVRTSPIDTAMQFIKM